MKKIFISNKGVTITDVVIAIIIIVLFIGILTTTFYRLYYNTMMSRIDAIAVNYAVNIAEKIDEMTYDEVTTEQANTIIDNVIENTKIFENFVANITVENYNKNDSTKKDIIKLVNIKISYEFMDKEKSYTIKKIKIKE